MSAKCYRVLTALPHLHAPANALLILRPGRAFPLSVVWDIADEAGAGEIQRLLAAGLIEAVPETSTGASPRRLRHLSLV